MKRSRSTSKSVTSVPSRSARTSARRSLSWNRTRLTRPMRWSYWDMYARRSSARLRSMANRIAHDTRFASP